MLKAADAIYKVVKAMQELPAAVEDFFRQVVTANRVLRSAFAGIPQLTLEAEQHAKELLLALNRGQEKCTEIGERGSLATIALSKSDGKALQAAADGVTKYLGMCVAEVAADAAPRLAAMQHRLSQMATVTAEDHAKLAALPEARAQATGNGPNEVPTPPDGEVDLERTSTRRELEETQRALKQLMEKQKRIEQEQKRMEEELAHKQDVEQSPQCDQEVSIGVGGGSMQVQASAAAAAQAAQGQGAASGSAVLAVQMQEQIAGLQAEVVRHTEHITELREQTGLQLSLPDALAKIRDFLGVTQAEARRPNDVLTKAKEFDIFFDEAGSLRVKVGQVCGELGIETGWGVQVAAVEPEYDDEQREELITGGGGYGGAAQDDDDIC